MAGHDWSLIMWAAFLNSVKSQWSRWEEVGLRKILGCPQKVAKPTCDPCMYECVHVHVCTWVVVCVNACMCMFVSLCDCLKH